LHRYQNKGLARGAVRICMKTNEMAMGKKGKTEAKRQ
jgi:hypothetical protein